MRERFVGLSTHLDPPKTPNRLRSDTGPFTIIPEWLLDSKVSDRAIRLYGLLGRYADRDGRSHPSRRKLAERLCCSPNSVDRARLELEVAEALVVERRLDDDGQTTNLYIIKRSPPVGTPLPTPEEGPLPTGEEGRTRASKELSSTTETSVSVAAPVQDAKTQSLRQQPETSVQPLVAHFVDEANAMGAEPPKRIVGQMARELKNLAGEGATEEELRACIALLLAKSLGPSLLPSLLFEVRQRGTTANGTDPLGTLLTANAGRWPTGSRMVRGSHGVTYVRDPLGYDKPQEVVTWGKPTRQEVLTALKGNA